MGTKNENDEDDDIIINVYINIQKDPYTELEQTYHYQYYNFRSMINIPNKNKNNKIKYIISNAGNASYSIAWDDSTTFVSSGGDPSDENTWKRLLNTSYNKDTGELSWVYEHNNNNDVVYFAYFPPYSYERHLKLISLCNLCPKANVFTLGQTLDGREMDCIQIGTTTTTTTTE